MLSTILMIYFASRYFMCLDKSTLQLLADNTRVSFFGCTWVYLVKGHQHHACGKGHQPLLGIHVECFAKGIIGVVYSHGNRLSACVICR